MGRWRCAEVETEMRGEDTCEKWSVDGWYSRSFVVRMSLRFDMVDNLRLASALPLDRVRVEIGNRRYQGVISSSVASRCFFRSRYMNSILISFFFFNVYGFLF